MPVQNSTGGGFRIPNPFILLAIAVIVVYFPVFSFDLTELDERRPEVLAEHAKQHRARELDVLGALAVIEIDFCLIGPLATRGIGFSHLIAGRDIAKGYGRRAGFGLFHG